MGFQEDKLLMLEALRRGQVIHEERSYQDDKNRLATGAISDEEAVAILTAARGQNSTASVHHYDSELKVWIMKPTVAGISWYIKAYLQEGKIVFLSFHHSQGSQS